jgi:hypothetical protein
MASPKRGLNEALKLTLVAILGPLCRLSMIPLLYHLSVLPGHLIFPPFKSHSITFRRNHLSSYYSSSQSMMASSQSTRKNQTEKRRRGKLGLIDSADKVAMIGAKVLVILEIDGKYSIYDSQPDKAWVPSNAFLVRWKIATHLSSRGAD